MKSFTKRALDQVGESLVDRPGSGATELPGWWLTTTDRDCVV